MTSDVAAPPPLAPHHEVFDDRPDQPPSKGALIGAALLAVVCVIAGAGAAIFVGLGQTKVWRAAAEIEYRQHAITETAEILVSSHSVWGPIIADYDMEPKYFLEHFGTMTVGGTQAVQVWFDDENPQRAKEILDRIVEQHLMQFDEPGPTLQADLLREQLATLRELETDLEELVAQLTAQAGNVPTPVLSERVSELTAVRGQITNVLTQIDQREIEAIQTAAVATPTIITPPYVLSEPVEPQLAKLAVLGAGGGGLIAAVAAFFMFNRSVNRMARDAAPQ